jgi:creatinine amidohydrolase
VPFYKLEELRYPQLDGFDRAKTLFVIAVSPLEEHGPHLPLGVDAFDAEHFSDEISRVFLEKYPEWNVVRIPTLYIGSFLFDAPGSIRVRPRTIRNLLVDILSSLAKYRFPYFLISNAHGGPSHIVALEEAARIVSRRFGVRAVSYSGHMIWNFLRGPYLQEIKERLQLTDADLEALKQDSHAGEWETSMMLKLRPDLVDSSYKSLHPFTVKWMERLRPNYPLKTGERLGYVGHPSRANETLADVSSKFLTEKAFELVEKDLLTGERLGSSPFYWLRTNVLAIAMILLLLIILGGLATLR